MATHISSNNVKCTSTNIQMFQTKSLEIVLRWSTPPTSWKLLAKPKTYLCQIPLIFIVMPSVDISRHQCSKYFNGSALRAPITLGLCAQPNFYQINQNVTRSTKILAPIHQEFKQPQLHFILGSRNGSKKSDWHFVFCLF